MYSSIVMIRYFRHYLMYKYVFTQKMKMEFVIEDPNAPPESARETVEERESQDSYLVILFYFLRN